MFSCSIIIGTYVIFVPTTYMLMKTVNKFNTTIYCRIYYNILLLGPPLHQTNKIKYLTYSTVAHGGTRPPVVHCTVTVQEYSPPQYSPRRRCWMVLVPSAISRVLSSPHASTVPTRRSSFTRRLVPVDWLAAIKHRCRGRPQRHGVFSFSST